MSGDPFWQYVSIFLVREEDNVDFALHQCLDLEGVSSAFTTVLMYTFFLFLLL